VPDELRSRLLDLLRKHVCADARVDGNDLVDGSSHPITLRITASAVETSLQHHGDPEAAAGALLTDTEEELHFAALGSDGLLTVVIS
jgi:hypothetical protein